MSKSVIVADMGVLMRVLLLLCVINVILLFLTLKISIRNI